MLAMLTMCILILVLNSAAGHRAQIVSLIKFNLHPPPSRGVRCVRAMIKQYRMKPALGRGSW